MRNRTELRVGKSFGCIHRRYKKEEEKRSKDTHREVARGKLTTDCHKEDLVSP